MVKRRINLQLFAVANFIPQVWSAQLLNTLKATLVYGQDGVINRNYQGEITAYGDTVKINTLGTVTVGDYVKNTDMADPQNLDGSQQVLTITQSKYFNFQVDDVDNAQTNPKLMTQAMVEAGYALRNTADGFIASTMAAGVKPSNIIGSDSAAVVLTAENTISTLVDLQTILDENNVPEEGRFAILPPWVHAMIEKSDKWQYTDANAQSVIRNGVVGRIAGFNILKSNNVPNVSGAKYKIIAGHAMATTYAEQINDVEAYRMEKRFADAVKGLHLYGAKVVRPEALAMVVASKK